MVLDRRIGIARKMGMGQVNVVYRHSLWVSDEDEASSCERSVRRKKRM